MKDKKIVLIIFIMLVIQTLIFILLGVNKSYIHMDEAYSLGLASYDKTEIQDNEDFYNTWHSGKYYEDYLTVEDDEKYSYSQVYVNQKNDVHPPFYYLLLRFAMGFNLNNFSMWSGIIINIIIYFFITIFMYLILQRLMKGEEHVKLKSILLSFISSITMASLTNVLYIRMYALATLNILIITYLHLKLLESKTNNCKILLLMGIAAVLGSLTHYYYLFYLAMLFMIFVIKYIKEKDYKKLAQYVCTMILAGIISLIIFPYSIQHMLFSNRGQGIISNLTNISKSINQILEYVEKINRFTFNNLLSPIIAAIILLYLCYIIKLKKVRIEKNEVARLIAIPTLFYFIVVSIVSPYIELRYVASVSGLIFVLVMYYLYKLLKKVCKEKISNIILCVLLVIILIAPFVFKIEPEVMYSDKKEIVQMLENELNLPTIYCFNSRNNRFLDDILLFAKIRESYVAKDIEYTENSILKILEGKDISKGIVIFINEGQDNNSIIKLFKTTAKKENSIYLKRLNACDVYLIK